MAQEQDNAGSNADEDLGAQLDALLGDLRQSEPDLVKNALKAAEENAKQASAAETPRAAEATDDSSESQAEAEDKDLQTMDAIDALLADQADDAVAGEFETVNDVLAAAEPDQAATDEPAATESPVEQPTAEAPADQPVADRRGAAPPPQEDEDLDFEGTFDTPEQVIAESDQPQAPDGAAPPEPQATEPQPVEGSSESVGQELDEQPEPVEVSASASDEPPEPQSAVQQSAESQQPDKNPAVVVVTKALKRGGYVMNLPIARLSESKRQMVGYVALLTMFNGVMWFGFNLVKAMFAGG